MNLDWSPLNNIPNAGEAFAKGLETGRAARIQRDRQNALTGMARGDPAALNALMAIDPQTAMQYQQQQVQQRRLDMKAQGEISEASRQNVIRGAQILRQINPKDDASYQQALQAARQMGIDVSTVPQQFDPQFVQNMIAAADTFEPQKAESSPYQVVAGQPGAGVYRFNKGDGSMSVLVQPNDGTAPMGAPAPQQTKLAAPPGAVAMLRSNPALRADFDAKYGQGAAAQALGGQTQPASGTFQP